jgi:hypothetical protein
MLVYCTVRAIASSQAVAKVAKTPAAGYFIHVAIYSQVAEALPAAKYFK